MWFKRKARNRRIGRDFVLDVKLRSSQVRASRARMAAAALGIIFAVVLGVFFLLRGGQWVLNALLYENSAFAIQTIDVQTDGAASLEQIRKWAGVRLGYNLLALDSARVRRDLELVSIIQRVSVERVLPHTLRIRVFEREPLAQIKVPRPKPGGGLEMTVLQLDEESWVMVPLDPQQRSSQSGAPEVLPDITGLPDMEVQAGRKIAMPQVQGALELLKIFAGSEMEGITEIKRIDVSALDVLTVTTGQGSEVVFALSGIEQQVRRWQLIQETGQRVGKAVATLDLAVSNNVPVRWLEASALPPSPPKIPKPLRNRKRHV